MRNLLPLFLFLILFSEAQAQKDKNLSEKIALINNVTDLFNNQYQAGSGIGCSFGLQGNIREWDSTAQFILSYHFNDVDWKTTQIQADENDLLCLEAKCKADQACFTLINAKNKRKTYRSARLFCVSDEQKQVLTSVQSGLMHLIPYFE